MPGPEAVDNGLRTQPRQKRARSTLSCTLCRQGKLKCDRSHPCNQCQKRSREDACNYLPPAQKSRSGQNVRNRIMHLEQMVVDLMNSNQSSSGQSTKGSTGSESQGISPSRDSRNVSFSGLTPPHDADGYAYPGSVEETQKANEGAFGRMQISKKETRFIGETHWSAVLTSISDLKREVSDDEENDANGEDDDDPEDVNDKAPSGMNNLLRSPIRRSKVELIEALPLRAEVDRYTHIWFNAADAFKPIIHPPTFQEEYTRFWKDPFKTPTMWIGLLYCILSLSAGNQFYMHPDQSSLEGQSLQKLSLQYHEYAASAMALADYTTPKPYAIECLSLYVGGLRSQTAFIDIWQLMGLMIRLSLRAGYHRDGSHFPNLSVFEQEMRRRIWHQMFMVDLLISFQIGLPSQLKSIDSDTKTPGNYLDSELSTRMTVLPESRPPSELTPVSYGLAKTDICRVFAQVFDLWDSRSLPSQEQIIRLDAELEAARENLPAQVQIRPFHQYIADKPETIMWSYNLRLLYLKVKTVLHRPFMASRKTDSFSLASRQSCVDAAMQTLGHHQEVWLASQSGGQLEFARSYMGTISTHDYLLAAMILCLELSHQCDEANQTSSQKPPVAEEKRDKMVDLLKSTRQIWRKDASDYTVNTKVVDTTWQEQNVINETKKASRALDAMVARIESMQSPGSNNNMPTMSTTASSYDPEPLVQSTSDISFMAPSWTPSSWNPPNNAGDPALDVVDTMMNIPEDQFDWSTFDHTFTGAPNITDEAGWTFDPAMMSDLMGDSFSYKDPGYLV